MIALCLSCTVDGVFVAQSGHTTFPTRSNKVDEIFDNAKIIEACYQAVKDWHITIPKSKTDVEFVLETIAGMHNLLADREGTADLNATLRSQIDKLQRDYRASDDTVKALRTALSDHNDQHQIQINRVIEMLKLIVETPVTHGQKNGMILLVAEIAQRFAYHDLYLGDIPF